MAAKKKLKKPREKQFAVVNEAGRVQYVYPTKKEAVSGVLGDDRIFECLIQEEVKLPKPKG